MTTLTFKPAALADLSTCFGPHWRNLWNAVKQETGSKVRKPSGVSASEAALPVHLNDGECARRFAFNLLTGEVSSGLHVSSGEWACHAGSNNDAAVNAVPVNTCVVTVTWHDYYRYLSIAVQVYVGGLPKSLAT